MTTAAPAANLTDSGLYHGWMPTPDTRGTSDLLWSCVFTIFLCVWTAIHPPLPIYRKERTKFLQNWRKWSRRTINESKVVPALISFIAPEVIVFNAVGDILSARAVKEDLEVFSNGQFSIIHAFYLTMGGFCLRSPNGRFRQLTDLDFAPPDEASKRNVTAHPEDATATEEAHVTSRIEGRSHELGNFNEIADLGAANGSRVSFNFDHANSTEETSVTPYTEDHFHDLENSNELDNLGGSRASSDLDTSGKIVVEDWIAQLMKFNEDDIYAVSKADSLTKMITCFQALWFVTQVVSRLVENRAVTLLEVSTCAYVFSAFIAYLC